jgi:hypothetical protein
VFYVHDVAGRPPYDAVLPWLFVANPKLVQEHDVNGDEGEAWLKENEAGGGPFTIKRWEIGNIYEFERYPDYWFNPENGIKPLDGFVWKIIRESSTKRIAMETGELQYGDRFSPEDDNALAADAREPVVLHEEGGAFERDLALLRLVRGFHEVLQGQGAAILAGESCVEFLQFCAANVECCGHAESPIHTAIISAVIAKPQAA